MRHAQAQAAASRAQFRSQDLSREPGTCRGQTSRMAATGSWAAGETTIRWSERSTDRARTTPGYESVDVLAEIRHDGGHHWVVRQVKKRGDTGEALEAASADELRPLWAERGRWAHDRAASGQPFLTAAEMTADALGRYAARYGDLPDQPLEIWDADFMTRYEPISLGEFDAEWEAARHALDAADADE